MFVGVFAIVGLIAYLVIQSMSDDGTNEDPNVREEQNSSADLPGEWFPSQGRGHFTYQFSLERTPTPFCEGVEVSQRAADAAGTTSTAIATGTTAAATPTAAPATPTTDAGTSTASTPAPTSASGTPEATPTVPTNCYNSNPPSSGRHLGVQRNVDVGGGVVINIPPDPNVYPSDIKIPREAIPHALEHAGIYLAYNCDDDSACEEVVAEMERVANDRIDNHDDRVIMAADYDLPEGYIGLSSWSRVDLFPYADYTNERAEDFISTHACRIDWEGFC